MAEKKRKADQFALVSRDLERAEKDAQAPAKDPQEANQAQDRPDPWAGQRKPYGISMRTGLYAALKQVSLETGIPIARLVEQGALHVLEKYSYKQS